MSKPLLIIKLGLLGTFMAFFIGCAQRSGGLSGGIKDVIPPQLVKSSPDTFSTNFNGGKLRFEFNEFVEVSDMRRNLLVTPVLRYDPIVLASGKKVLVKNLDDSLWENTTYVMEFNEGIQDITERNPAKGFRYVFSTGDYVDSLELRGQLKDAFTLEPLEDMFAFLYEETGDSVPYKIKPRYVGRSDEQGFFHIRNMKKGSYKVFMTSDENKNYLFDKPSESLDFLDSNITISEDSSQFITGYMFVEDKGKQFLIGSGIINRWAVYISYKRKIDSLDVKFSEVSPIDEDQYSRSYNESRDSVVFWLNDSNLVFDTLQFYLKPDSFPVDTVTIVYYEDERPKKFKFNHNLVGGKMNLNENLELEYDFPIVSLDRGKILLLTDTIEIPYEIKQNKSSRKLTVIADWQEKQRYRLVMDSAAIMDINGFTNDSMNLNLMTFERSYYGTMDISLGFEKRNKGILMILNKKGKIIEQVYLDEAESHFFEFLHPGEYNLKYIIDENENGVWDPGNYLKHRHGEKVFIYQKKITIRSNWDQVIEWKFN